MALYESVIITRPELTDTQVESLIDLLSNIIINEKGTVPKKEKWGLRSFAYKINKNKKGNYFMLNLDCNPSAIFEYERQMRINEDILRFLTIKIEQIDNSPSILNLSNNDEKQFLSSEKKDESDPKELGDSQ